MNVSVVLLSVSPSELHYGSSYEAMRQQQTFDKVDPFTVSIQHTDESDVIEIISFVFS